MRRMPKKASLVMTVENLHTGDTKRYSVSDAGGALKKALEVLPRRTLRDIIDIENLFRCFRKRTGYVGKYFFGGEVYELTLITVT